MQAAHNPNPNPSPSPNPNPNPSLTLALPRYLIALEEGGELHDPPGPVPLWADTYARPGASVGYAYGLRVPASRVGYAPDAQGGLATGPRVLYVPGTRTSLGRTVRTAYRGNPGA